MVTGDDLFVAHGVKEFGAWREQMRARLRSGPVEERVVLVARRDSAPLFPAVCPNCMAPAGSELKVDRVYNLRLADSEGDISEQRTVEAFSFPVCGPCLQRHRAEQRPLGAGALLRRVLGFPGNGGLGVGGLAVFFVGLLLVNHGLQDHDWIALGVGCIPLLFGGLLLCISWRVNRHVTIPNDTTVSLSVEVTPELGVKEEPPWRAYRFRLPSYAGYFRQANENQLWDPNGSQAQAARARRKAAAKHVNWVYIAIGLIVVLVGVWAEYIEPFFDR